MENVSITPNNQNRSRQLRQYSFWCIFLIAVLGVSLWTHQNILGSGFWRDDFEFIEAFRHMTAAEAVSLWKPGAFWCYRPVFLLYWWLGLQIWGENAFAFHLASVLLHASAIMLFALLISRLTKQQWMGMAASGLFLLHPAVSASPIPFNERSINAITWISSVSTLLAALFAFATLHAWICWRQSGKKQFGILAFLFCWLALCSKEEAFALPFIIIVFDIILWPKVSRWRFIPIILVATTYAGLNYLTNHIAVSAQPNTYNYLHFALTDRLKTVAHYGLFIWNGVLPTFLPAGLGLFLLIGWLIRRQRVALGTWLWTFIAVLPVPMGVGVHALGTRFYYVPAFAVSGLSVIGISYLLSGGHNRGIERTLTRIVGVFWLLALVGSIVPFPFPDFAIFSCVLFCHLAITILLVKEKLLPPFWGSWLAILTVGFQLPFLGLDLPIGVLPFFIATLLCITFRKQWKMALIPAFVISYFADLNPVWYSLLATILINIAFVAHKTGHLNLRFCQTLLMNEHLSAAPKKLK